MASLESHDRVALKARCEGLCVDIKASERAFERQNGRKLTRKDVQADEKLRARYMEYENMKAVLSGKRPPHREGGKRGDKEDRPKTGKDENAGRDNEKKRKSGEMEPPAVAMTPSKRRAGREQSAFGLVSTPRKAASPNASVTIEIEGCDTPGKQKPTVLGPTPQKGGEIMGLFANLAASPGTIPDTPSRVPLAQVSANTQVASMTIPVTPSKSSSRLNMECLATPTKDDDFESPVRRFSRTPMSEGKRFMFSQFLTPKRPRDIGLSSDNKPSSLLDHQMTPSSVAKEFATPAFLRRYMSPPKHALGSVRETAEDVREERALFKRPPQLRRTKSLPFKGFYAMIKEREEIVLEQKQIEEDVRIDEEEELMREMEMEMEMEGMEEIAASALPKSVEPQSTNEVVVVPETQYEELLNAVLDDEGFLTGDIEAELKAADVEARKDDTTAAPVKVWKKKGLKRQTRRVIMRPHKIKSSTQDIHQNPSDNEHYSDLDDEDSKDEFDPSKSKTNQSTKPSNKSRQKSMNSTEARQSKKKGVPAALAQPNFRALKIKTKNSKGKGGRSSWGRGRR